MHKQTNKQTPRHMKRIKSEDNSEGKSYKVSKQTSLFIEALDHYQTTKDKFFHALTEMYGEDIAGRLFENVYGQRLDMAENALHEGLGRSITDSMENVNKSTI